MKTNTIFAVVCLLMALVVLSAYSLAGTISQTITERQIRDPKLLRPILNDNFVEIDNRTAGATAMSVTNGQEITVSEGTYVLSGIGGADDSTNTITLVAPTAAGQIVNLVMATATTNLVTLADSGTVAASGAILLDANDTAVLLAVDTSTWCLVSESDN